MWAVYNTVPPSYEVTVSLSNQPFDLIVAEDEISSSGNGKLKIMGFKKEMIDCTFKPPTLKPRL